MDNNITISIIEDHPTYIIGLNNLISPYSDLSIIATGQTVNEGKKILQQYQPNILLLDIDLPDGKGIQLLDYITDLKLNTRVIIISMYYDYIHMQLAEERGASGYLAKNSDSKKIVSAIYSVAKGQQFFEKMKSPQGVMEKISKREKQILELLSEGKSRIDISESLFISNETLKSHIKNLLTKTNTNSVTELITGYLRSRI
ncbi:MAG: response regulator transcription factor [Bacteroidia bacterium]